MSQPRQQVGTKALSFVITGRNDNYCGNFLHRMQLAINTLAQSTLQAGLIDALELLIVDWNSDHPLSQVLPLSEDGRAITRFIEVPPPVAGKYHTQPGQHFNSTAAANTGVRRARGRFVFCMPADAIIPQSALHNLHRLVSGRYPLHHDLEKTLLKIGRKMIPHQISDDESLGPRELEAYLADCSSTLYMGSNARITAGLGAIGGSRALWQSARGLSEACDGWGFNDIDFGLRMGQVYGDLELSHFGILFYDLEQAPDIYQRHQQRHANPHRYPRQILVNGPDWGLAEETALPDHLARDIAPVPAPPPAARQAGRAAATVATPQLKLPGTGEKLATKLASRLHELVTDSHPKRLLEFPARHFCLSTFLTQIDNTLDLALLAPWHLAADADDSLSPAELGRQLKELRHRGRCEFFVGEASDTLGRYKNKASPKVDLMIIHAEPWRQSADFTAETVNRVLSLLNERGQVLLIGRSAAPFEALATALAPSLTGFDSSVIDGYRLGVGTKAGPLRGRIRD